jgi:radical SAM-linked protein
MAGENEVMEFELCEWMPLATVGEALARQLPEGLLLRDLRAVSPHGRTAVTAIRYQVRFLAPPPVTDDQVATLLVRESVPVGRTRKGEPKTVDIRPFLTGLRLEGQCLSVECAVRDGSTTRPEEVLAALGVEVGAWLSRMEMTRTQTVLAEPTEAAGPSRPGVRRSARPRR